VTCPWHGSQFNVCTGAVLSGPAKDPLKTYRVVVEGEIGRVEEAQVQSAKSATNET
jgi:nitrite reductase/ring-hydroxylating ferredoxin subunit